MMHRRSSTHPNTRTIMHRYDSTHATANASLATTHANVIFISWSLSFSHSVTFSAFPIPSSLFLLQLQFYLPPPADVSAAGRRRRLPATVRPLFSIRREESRRLPATAQRRVPPAHVPVRMRACPRVARCAHAAPSPRAGRCGLCGGAHRGRGGAPPFQRALDQSQNEHAQQRRGRDGAPPAARKAAAHVGSWDHVDVQETGDERGDRCVAILYT